MEAYLHLDGFLSCKFVRFVASGAGAWNWCRRDKGDRRAWSYRSSPSCREARNTSSGPEHSVSAKQPICEGKNGNSRKEKGAREIPEESHVQEFCSGSHQVPQNQIAKLFNYCTFCNLEIFSIDSLDIFPFDSLVNIHLCWLFFLFLFLYFIRMLNYIFEFSVMKIDFWVCIN